MLKRLTITFTPDEREALDRLAQTDVRPVKEQVRFLLRAEAERRGLWPMTPRNCRVRGCAVDRQYNAKPHGGNRGASMDETATAGRQSCVSVREHTHGRQCPSSAAVS